MKTTTNEIIIALMKEYDFRQNIIVPNVSNMMRLVPFETDLIVLTKSNYAIGFEIKTIPYKARYNANL